MNRLAYLYCLAAMSIAACGWAQSETDRRNDDPGTAGGILQFQGLSREEPVPAATKTLSAGRQLDRGKIKYMRDTIPAVEIPPYHGERYQRLVPDTLDLAEHCRQAAHNMTGLTDPALDYDTYFGGGSVHCFSDICGVKFQEALPLMRIASGSTQNMHVDRAWMKAQLKSIGPDGLYYIHRPYLPDDNMFAWVNQIGTAKGIVPLKGHPLDQFCETVVQGRILGVFTLYFLRDKNPIWPETIEKAIDRISELTIDKGDYAYLPVRAYEPDATVSPDAPIPVDMWAEELAGRLIPGLAQYYRVSGNRSAGELCKKYVNYMRYHSHYFDAQGRFTQSGPNGVLVIEGGHFHAHALTLLSMLEFAIAAGDGELLQFVDKSYRWARENTYSSTQAGWFPELVRKEHTWNEPCCTADMVALAIKLSQAGARDYWDDADRWTRNQLVAAQNSEGGYGPGCCTGNAARALYYVWKNTLQHVEHRLRINLLLNRTSIWADVDSHIPYEGRVDIKLKMAMNAVDVRVPEWIESNSDEVICLVNDKPIALDWNGRFVCAGQCQAGDVLSLKFPIHESTRKERIANHDYTLVIKGNDIVSISPRGKHQYMPLYQREKYREDQARMIKRERFAPAQEIAW